MLNWVLRRAALTIVILVGLVGIAAAGLDRRLTGALPMAAGTWVVVKS